MDIEDTKKEAEELLKIASEKAKTIVHVATDEGVHLLAKAADKAKDILKSEEPPEYFRKHAIKMEGHIEEDRQRYEEQIVINQRQDNSLEQIKLSQATNHKDAELRHKEIMAKIDPVLEIVNTMSNARKYTIWVAGFLTAIVAIVYGIKQLLFR